jgi:hypothetical protein
VPELAVTADSPLANELLFSHGPRKAAGMQNSLNPSLPARGLRLAGKAPLTCLLLVVGACWSPYFLRSLMPVHDSMYMYQAFYYFYSELLSTGDLARWFPYGNFGTPADSYQTFLHPTDYLVAAVGWLFNVRDTMALWKVTVLLNELLFAGGLFLLSRQLYRQRLTQMLITLTGALSVSWLVQSTINLGTFYLLPLEFWLLLRFFRTGSVGCLCLVGLVEIGSTLGAVPYFPPLHALVLSLFAAPLCIQHRQALRGLLSVRNLWHPCVWLLVLAAGIFAAFMLGGRESLTMLTLGRDPVTGQVTLQTFLDYGRMPLGTTLLGFVAGAIPHADNTYYIGLLPLALFGYALVTEKSREFIGLAAGFCCLLWLSFGGHFASLVYYLPGMRMFRHVGLVFGVGSLLVLLASGFGLERVLLRLSRKPCPLAARLWPRMACLGLVGGLLVADYYVCRDFNDLTQGIFTHPQWKLFFGFRVALYYVGGLVFLACWLRNRRSSQVGPAPVLALSALMLADIGSFRAEVYWTAARPTDYARVPGLFDAMPLPYVAMRQTGPPSDRARARLTLLHQPGPGVHHSMYLLLCGFAHMDAYRPPYRGDFMTTGTYQMLSARGETPEPFVGGKVHPPSDPALLRSLGCNAPKLRLTRHVRVVHSEHAALAAFAALPSPDTAVVLLPDDPQSASSYKPDDRDVLGAVAVEDFSSNRIRMAVDVEGQEPAWLVYADAWHPGWKASIDQQDTPIARANLGFKAVAVEPGRHIVEFVYRDPTRTRLAWCFAGLGMLCGTGLCVGMAMALVRELRGAFQRRRHDFLQRPPQNQAAEPSPFSKMAA